MDIEDTNELFDTERLKRKLTMIYVQKWQEALEAYEGREAPNPDVDIPEMRAFAQREAIAELIVQNNRVLWHAVEQQFCSKPDENTQP